MRLLYSITHTLAQSGLTALLLIIWRIWIVQDVFAAIQSQVILTAFIGLFGLGFGILFHQLSTVLRVLVTSIATAFMVTLALTTYPQFGYDFNFLILFGILMISSILAHTLLYGSGARYGDNRHETN